MTLRVATTVTFDAEDAAQARDRVAALRSALLDSDALPAYPVLTVTEPYQAGYPWPSTDQERDSFLDWQSEVGAGETTPGQAESV